MDSSSSSDAASVESVPDELFFSRDVAAHAYGSIAALVGADSDTEYSGSDDDGGVAHDFDRAALGDGARLAADGGDGDSCSADVLGAVKLSHAPWTAARDAEIGGAVMSASGLAACVGSSGATTSRLSMLETFVQRAHATWATRLADEAVGEFVRDYSGGSGGVVARGHANRATGGDSEGDENSDDGDNDAGGGDGSDGEDDDDDDDDGNGGDDDDDDKDGNGGDDDDDDDGSDINSVHSSDVGECAPVRTLSCAACFSELARGDNFELDTGAVGHSQWILSALGLSSLIVDESGTRVPAESLDVRGKSADALLLTLRCATCCADVGGRDLQGGGRVVSIITQGIANGFSL